MAKLECTIKREGGTEVEVNGVTYHFEPQADGAHVAEISDQGNAAVLLKITEAYRPYKAAGAGPTPAQLAAKEAAEIAAKEQAEAEAAALAAAEAQAIADAEEAEAIVDEEADAEEAEAIVDEEATAEMLAAPLTPAQKGALTKAAKAAAGTK